VKSPGTILDERQDRPATLQFGIDGLVCAVKCRRHPSALRQLPQQRIGADARGAAIDQMRERFRGETTLAPVAQHHRGGSAAAEVFGLGNERNVEDGERLVLTGADGRWPGLGGSGQRHDHDERARAVSPLQR